MFRSAILLACLCAGGTADAQSISDQVTFASCEICHGDGRGEQAIPAIRGRPYEEIMSILTAYSADAGTGTIMHRFLVALSPSEIDSLARHVASLNGESR